MPPLTPGSHCLGKGCDHDSARTAAVAHPAAAVRGRRVRGGKHVRSAATAATGRRSA
jgi:hypothetical protein